MIGAVRCAAFLVVALSTSVVYAQSTQGTWMMLNQSESGWDSEEWARPFNERPGYENLNDCQPGMHGVPAPNGNSFRCVQNGY
jgi:hypothetical protein